MFEEAGDYSTIHYRGRIYCSNNSSKPSFMVEENFVLSTYGAKGFHSDFC